MLSLIAELTCLELGPDEIEQRVRELVNSGQYVLSGTYKGERIGENELRRDT